MGEPLDEQYLKWLYRQVASVRLKDPNRTYWNLLRHLYTTEFVWLIPNDDNRVEDGRDLRHEFLTKKGIVDCDPNWLSLGCSFLEMLYGLARRSAFEAEGGSSEWFWHMLDNLTLGEFNDVHYHSKKQARYVSGVLDRVIWRRYEPNGVGGLFPLRRPQDDQREVELWYQLSCYLLEGHTARP